MQFQSYFPIWDQLLPRQQRQLLESLTFQTIPKDAILPDAGMHCTGLYLIRSGQLRAYVFSEEGREITIYRLFARDLCLFSAPGILHSLRFEVTIVAEKDTQLWRIPAELYRTLMDESAAVAGGDHV